MAPVKKLVVPKGPAGSCWFSQTWLFVVVLGAVIVFTYFVGIETKEGPIEVVGVVEKDHTKTSEGVQNIPAPIPAAPEPMVPLPTVPIPVPPAVPATTPAPIKPVVPAPAPVPPPTNVLPASTVPLQKDLSKIENLVSNLELARKEMVKELKEDYGEKTFNDLFFYTKGNEQVGTERVSLGKVIFKTPNTNGPSMDRFRSKMMRKILQVMLQAKKQNSETTSLRRGLADDNKSSSSADGVRFVWATGGHSATAGHGNMYDESYTAFLERMVRPVFAAMGIDFTGRNYAMGGTNSAPETAWCIDSIFGANDPDILVWDHGMTDGSNIEKMLLYFYRASLNRNRPAVIANHLGGKRHAQVRCSPVMEVENRGLAGLCSREALYDDFQDAVPDSLGLAEHEVKVMPKFVRNFKCGNLIEKGDPYCGVEKYNDTFCATRRFKAGWHPGWKWHGMQGHILAVFIVDLLEEAAREILAKSDKDPQELYNELQQKEDEEYEQFHREELPDFANKFLAPDIRDDVDLNLTHVYKSHAICHTAKVPAEIRHKGILTEGPPGDLFNYPQGISQTKADKSSDSEFMALVREDTSRQKCPVKLNIDHKDFFYVHQRDGWRKLAVPNDAEVAEYGRDEPFLGLIAVCFQLCAWGKCPAGNLLAKDVLEGKGQFEVNGAPVVNMTNFQNCDFLRGEKGHYWPSSDKYELRIRATAPNAYIRLGTVVIW